MISVDCNITVRISNTYTISISRFLFHYITKSDEQQMRPTQRTGGRAHPIKTIKTKLILKGAMSRYFNIFFKIPNMSCSELNSKNNGLGFFLKTIL